MLRSTVNRTDASGPSLKITESKARRTQCFSAVITIAFLTVLTHSVAGQTWVPLVDFEQVWRYETSGNDLGTAWRTNDFDDAGWPIGPGLLETGETTIYPAPFSTTLPSTDGKVTYYFRTRFEIPAEALTGGWQLFATNLVDDGCVIYLNGVEAGRVRMPTVYNHLTSATGAPTTEGQFDVVEITTPSVHVGENVLAVEVHQAGTMSSDLVWGMSLAASLPRPITILTPPVGGVYVIGDSVTLSVTADGSPIFYQWQKDGVNIAGATSAKFSFVADSELSSGMYNVVLTNRAGRVVSTAVDVSVFPDRKGPLLVSAIPNGSSSTNRIDVVFSETVNVGTTLASNFQVIRISDGQQVTISNTVASAATVRLIVGGPNWRVFDDYFVVVNNVKDRGGNSIAPGSRVPVSWQLRTTLISTNQNWFYAAPLGDPDIYNEPWMDNSYTPAAAWLIGPGPFSHLHCENALGTDVGGQAQPLLLRTVFQWPASNPPGAELQLRYAFDDGVIYYLNGSEIYRFNVPPGRPTLFSRAPAGFSLGCTPNTLLTVTLTNLLPGDNVLAAAVLQENSFQGADVLFTSTLSATHLKTPVLPSESVPALDIVQVSTGAVRVSWPGGGFCLESSTGLSSSLSYPHGPWLEVTNMANPVVYSLDTPFRFFRLRTP